MITTGMHKISALNLTDERTSSNTYNGQLFFFPKDVTWSDIEAAFELSETDVRGFVSAYSVGAALCALAWPTSDHKVQLRFYIRDVGDCTGVMYSQIVSTTCLSTGLPGDVGGRIIRSLPPIQVFYPEAAYSVTNSSVASSSIPELIASQVSVSSPATSIGLAHKVYTTSLTSLRQPASLQGMSLIKYTSNYSTTTYVTHIKYSSPVSADILFVQFGKRPVTTNIGAVGFQLWAKIDDVWKEVFKYVSVGNVELNQFSIPVTTASEWRLNLYGDMRYENTNTYMDVLTLALGSSTVPTEMRTVTVDKAVLVPHVISINKVTDAAVETWTGTAAIFLDVAEGGEVSVPSQEMVEGTPIQFNECVINLEV